MNLQRSKHDLCSLNLWYGRYVHQKNGFSQYTTSLCSYNLKIKKLVSNLKSCQDELFLIKITL